MILRFFLLLLLSVGAAANADLPLRVQRALDHRGVPHDTLSVYVENINTGEILVSWLAETPRTPASVEKMLTTLVALDELGPAYTWKTEIYALGDVRGEVLDGDILIKGYGDPFLVTERFWQMLRQLRRAGIRSIGGELLLDDSYFDVGDHDPAAFDSEPLRAYNVAPNALLSNFKVVRYFFEPDSASGKVDITLDPPLDNIEVINRLSVRQGACSGYQRGITITPNDDVSRVTFSGRFPSGCEIYAMDRTALSHNAFTYGLFASLWRQLDGEFSGRWRKATAPEDLEPLLTVESLSLAEIITRVNKHSNNVMARQLLYTLAAERLGSPGTESGGRSVIGEWLAARGFSLAELKLDNGAGLSRDSRMTAVQLGAVLRYAWSSPTMPEYVSSLSLSGLDGTLSRRFRDRALAGKAHMKTGSLDDVSAFAGYFQARSGARFIVVAMHNHKDIHRGPGEEVQEALLRWLYEQ